MQDINGARLQRLLFDKRVPSATFEGPQVATVVSATATTLMFTISSYHEHVAFGPAPYPRPALHSVALSDTGGTITPASHSHDTGLPPPGTRCLVMFLGAGVDEPYVVAFYGWPS